MVRTIPVRVGRRTYLRHPIVGVGLRVDDENDHRDWQFVTYTAAGFGLSFVRDVYSDWSKVWIYRSGTRRCTCPTPEVRDNDIAWCCACAGEIALAAPAANYYCRCPFPTRQAVRTGRCTRCRGDIR